MCKNDIWTENNKVNKILKYQKWQSDVKIIKRMDNKRAYTLFSFNLTSLALYLNISLPRVL